MTTTSDSGALSAVCKEPGVRMDGESMKVYGQFGRAILAEREGNHEKAEEYLRKAVEADCAARGL